MKLRVNIKGKKLKELKCLLKEISVISFDNPSEGILLKDAAVEVKLVKVQVKAMKWVEMSAEV